MPIIKLKCLSEIMFWRFRCVFSNNCQSYSCKFTKINPFIPNKKKISSLTLRTHSQIWLFPWWKCGPHPTEQSIHIQICYSTSKTVLNVAWGLVLLVFLAADLHFWNSFFFHIDGTIFYFFLWNEAELCTHLASVHHFLSPRRSGWQSAHNIIYQQCVS